MHFNFPSYYGSSVGIHSSRVNGAGPASGLDLDCDYICAYIQISLSKSIFSIHRQNQKTRQKYWKFEILDGHDETSEFYFNIHEFTSTYMMFFPTSNPARNG